MRTMERGTTAAMMVVVSVPCDDSSDVSDDIAPNRDVGVVGGIVGDTVACGVVSGGGVVG